MGAKVNRVVVTDLRDNTFFAVIEMQASDGSSMILDSRPSDAIALALRVDCPIYVDINVIQASRSATPSLQDEASDLEVGDDDWPDVIGEVGDLPM